MSELYRTRPDDGQDPVGAKRYGSDGEAAAGG